MCPGIAVSGAHVWTAKKRHQALAALPVTSGKQTKPNARKLS